METRDHAHTAHELVPDTLAVLDAFGDLAATATRLAERAEALRHEWAAVTAESHVCEWGQEPTDLALGAELTDWVDRVSAITVGAHTTASRGTRRTDAADPPVADFGPGYFVG
jgi:hypothetical protein